MTSLDHTIRLINELYPEAPLPNYGTKDELIGKVVALLEVADDVLRYLRQSVNAEHVVFDRAGIGDSIYARLIMQHIGNAAWITIPFVSGLYKDDPTQVYPGFASPYRDARQRWIVEGLSPALSVIFKRYFPFSTDVSGCVGSYYSTWIKNPTTYADLFFGAVGIKRDTSILASLVHHGKPTIELPERYVVLEHASKTFGPIATEPYVELVARLADIGISVVHVGGVDDPDIDGVVCARGLSYYDTFSLLKGALAFIGRSSGNESLTGFLPELPVFEVRVPAAASFAKGIRPRNSYSVSLSNMTEEVTQFCMSR